MTPITGEISLFLELDIKEKRVTISDYFLVDISFEISNISFTPKDFFRNNFNNKDHIKRQGYTSISVTFILYLNPLISYLDTKFQTNSDVL